MVRSDFQWCRRDIAPGAIGPSVRFRLDGPGVNSHRSQRTSSATSTASLLSWTFRCVVGRVSVKAGATLTTYRTAVKPI